MTKITLRLAYICSKMKEKEKNARGTENLKKQKEILERRRDR